MVERNDMALRLKPNRPLSDEIRRLTDRRLAVALKRLDRVDQANHESVEDAVFEVRKKCKQVRAIAKSVRVPLGDEYFLFNQLVREAAGELAPLRDAHAALKTVDDLRSDSEKKRRKDLDVVLAKQTEVVQGTMERLLIDESRLRRCSELLTLARGRVVQWNLPDDPEILAVGIRAIFKKGKREFGAARRELTTDRLHRWRSSVKVLWYETRMIEAAAPDVLTPLVEQLDELAQILGADHDLTILIERLESKPKQAGGKKRSRRAVKAARKQRKRLRKEAIRRGAPIYEQSTGDFAEQIVGHWLGFATSSATREVDPERGAAL